MKGVLFDFNGTRFFDSPLHCRAWKRIALEYFHKQLTDEDLDKNVQGRPNNLILSYLSPRLCQRRKGMKLLMRKRSGIVNSLPLIQLFFILPLG